jgi:formate hydrogenlyase transcriptional activator
LDLLAGGAADRIPKPSEGAAAVAPLPPGESSRLEALAAYGILDTEPEQAYDDLVLLAAQVCGAPMALISLIDGGRQWFKARIGLDMTETPREVSFCAHTILRDEVFVVPDTAADPRFAGNPLVTGEPGVRFYAGAPLVAPGGHKLGSVCVIDHVPRTLTGEQSRALEAIGREVVARLELRRTNALLERSVAESRAAEEALRSSEELKTRIIECSRDCIKVLDLDGRLLSMNAGGLEALEICDLAPYCGTPWADFWEGKDREAAIAAVDAARRGGIGRFVGYFETRQNRRPRWWDVVVSPVRDGAGLPERLLAVSRDVTERKRSEDLFRTLAEATASTTGTEFFASLVRHVAEALRVRYAFVTECVNENRSVRMLAFWQNRSFGDNLQYDLAGTPCEDVIGGDVRCHPRNLRELFPEDKGLVDWEAESFLGIPLRSHSGEVIGHLAILDDRPMEEQSLEISILRVFADRAGAELERLNADRALEAMKNRLQAENVYLQEEIRTQHNFEEIVGNSPALLEALSRVERVAGTDATVLIQGETGAGKELFARAIHSRSLRAGRPLVKVNCGAIPAGLVESELFGHVKGAFTGALEKRTGRFELADSGTIFLDEVGELPLDTQVKLLRVLQEKEFEAVGSSRTVRVNVRVIAASNRDLERAVAEGRFRADLLYRLNVFPIEVPALRERRSDIPLLAAFFLEKLSRSLGKPLEGFSRRSMSLLTEYPWPGNIRELQNVVERAAILAQGPVVEADAKLFGRAPETAPDRAPRSLAEVERAAILDALRACGGTIEGPGGAAVILGLHPNTLRSRVKKMGIEQRREIS